MSWIRRTALLLSAVLSVIAQATDVCDSVCHCLEYETEFVIVNCKGYKGHHPDVDFELFEWPKTENRSIKAFFNNLSIHLLPKISGDSKVISLNFDDNLIRTIPMNPFEYFTGLESISVANNIVTELTKDFLKSTTTLKSLSLANNSLSNIDPNVVAHLKELHDVDLSLNEFTKLSADLIEAFSSVEILKMENNKIFTIDNAYSKIDYKFKQFFFAGNQFAAITVSMFEKFQDLQSIDLSNNKINNIDENAFVSLSSLKLLDLSYNNIKRAFLRLPESLELLSMANNQLVTWPLANLPKHLAELELQVNSLEYIFPKDREFDSLRTLDVSNNLIEQLPNTQFSKLDRLDLSYNHLTSVPQNLNSMTPMLRDLILNGNRISSVHFSEKTMLGSVSLKFIPNLERIEANAFSNLAGVRVSPDGSGTCVDIHLSHNENLREIAKGAFDGVDLCHLDLSYNKLVKVSRNLTDWARIKDGIDLQGNPLSCNCEDQWMLDELLYKLYENTDHQYFLLDLKCQSPEDLKGQRLVQFLNHDNPFCGVGTARRSEKMVVQESNFGGFSFGTSDEKKNIQFELTHGPGFIIIIVLCSLLLIVMVLVGLKWQRDQDRKLALRNRRYEYDY